MKFEKYQDAMLFLEKNKYYFDSLNQFCKMRTTSSSSSSSQTDIITLDFILNNEIIFTFEKNEFINDYLVDFISLENEENEQNEQDNETHSSHSHENLLTLGKEVLEKLLLPEQEEEEQEQEQAEIESFSQDDDDKPGKENSIIDYDFIIINGTDNLKKIIKRSDVIKNNLESEDSSVFKFEPFPYKPLLCEFWNGDENVIKIDFCDNNKCYDFLVVGNCFDRKFLVYFMKKYYNVEVKDNYVLKILDSDVNSFLFDSSDVMKLEEKFISNKI
jgi:hypothetical protein